MLGLDEQTRERRSLARNEMLFRQAPKDLAEVRKMAQAVATNELN